MRPESPRARRERGPKGRAIDDTALAEVHELLGARPRRRDLLIEHLHLIQDRFGCLHARHLRALAEEMRLAQAEVELARAALVVVVGLHRQDDDLGPVQLRARTDGAASSTF